MVYFLLKQLVKKIGMYIDDVKDISSHNNTYSPVEQVADRFHGQ